MRVATGRAIAKRTIDVVVSAALLLIVLPVIILSVLATAISLRTWPLFTQTRIGRDGRPFRIIKVRTLPRSTPPYVAKTELTLQHVPPFSRMLRKLHLDELPQLFLVLIGKMSLVGPRPEMPQLHERFEPAFAARRERVRPGCTGLWQISETCNGLIYEHPEFDEYYIENRSLALDLWIMRRSIALLLPFGQPDLVSYTELPRPMVRPSESSELAASPLPPRAPRVPAGKPLETADA